jgi:hypothetical protein
VKPLPVQPWHRRPQFDFYPENPYKMADHRDIFVNEFNALPAAFRLLS